MFSFLKWLLGPTRFDACCIVIATHWLTVVLVVTLTPILANSNQGQVGLECINAVAGCTWIAIAASLCWRGFAKQRVFLLIASSVASLVFSQAWYWLNPEFVGSFKDQQPVRSLTVFAERGAFLHQCEGVILWALAAVAVYLTSHFFRFVAGKISPYFRSLTGKLPADRTKGLVMTAGVLFVFALVARLPNSLGIGPTVGQFDMTEFLLASVVFLIAWLVALVWFTHIWATPRKPVQKALTFLLVLAGFVFAGVSNFRSIPLILILALAAPSFIATVIGIGGRKVENGQNHETQSFKPAFRPSLISLATVLGLCLAVSVPLLIGVGPMGVALSSFAQFRNPPSALELFELTMNSAKARWGSGGRIDFGFDSYNMVPVWKVKFDDSAAPDLLSSLPSSGAVAVELNGMTPEFDASFLQDSSGFVILKDCRLTHTQLEQILASTSGLEVKGSLVIVDDGHTVDPGVLSTVSIRDTEPGVARDFFAATNCCSQVTFAMFNTPMTNEDWTALEDVSQSAQVYLQGGFAPDFKLPKSPKSLVRVMCLYYGEENSLDANLEKELFLKTDMNLYFSSINTQTPKTIWKLWILRGTSGHQSFEYLFDSSNQSIGEFAKELGMAYEMEEDLIRSLYFPAGMPVTQIADLKDLRVLSFDPGWVKPGANLAAFGAMATPLSISHLGSLSSLEELYFGALFVPQDLSILAKLKSLKHLQIPAVVRKVTGPVGFDACSSLESITFFGVPDNQSWREISRLPNLKRLTIIDHDTDETLTPKYAAKVKEKFPGVEVSVLKLHENEPQIPKAFRDYRDRLRKELRSDTKWLDELLKRE
jgi:hypothetical protein